ncbi:MAG: nucleotidyltransferase substrate binding protein [Methylococcaceae bacterium]|nr:nucleotidyltransferase substrate binding protein [Methylococcaceae bacterium]
MDNDIRWKQRFSNFKKAFLQLKEAVDTYDESAVDIIKEGVIQRFEFTHELAWKVMKDFLEYEGYQNITGFRSATRQAFNIGLIEEGQVWMNMIESRNRTVHTYHEDVLEVEYKNVIGSYFLCFSAFYEKMATFL